MPYDLGGSGSGSGMDIQFGFGAGDPSEGGNGGLEFGHGHGHRTTPSGSAYARGPGKLENGDGSGLGLSAGLPRPNGGSLDKSVVDGGSSAGYYEPPPPAPAKSNAAPAPASTYGSLEPQASLSSADFLGQGYPMSSFQHQPPPSSHKPQPPPNIPASSAKLQQQHQQQPQPQQANLYSANPPHNLYSANPLPSQHISMPYMVPFSLPCSYHLEPHAIQANMFSPVAASGGRGGLDEVQQLFQQQQFFSTLDPSGGHYMPHQFSYALPGQQPSGAPAPSQDAKAPPNSGSSASSVAGPPPGFTTSSPTNVQAAQQLLAQQQQHGTLPFYTAASCLRAMCNMAVSGSECE